MSMLRGFPSDPMRTGYGHIPDPGDQPDHDPDVCVHGEACGDCDACEFGDAIDAYDAGWLDD